jgi:uncharacterized protein (TIGR02996 family)
MPRRSPPAVPPPRPEVLAFLRDAKDHPEDDTPRLVLADWLDDHGDEADQARAAHLRAQCRLARLKRGDPEWEDVAQEVQALEDQHVIGWLGPLSTGKLRRSFVRGLVRLRARARWVLGPRNQALSATETWTWVEGLELESTRSRDVAELAACVALGSLSSLSLDCWSWEDTSVSAKALAASPHLKGLVSLKLSSSNPTILGLLESPHLTCLTSLGLPRCQLNTAKAWPLLALPYLERLTNLDLSSNDLDDAFVETLAACPHLTNLRSLNLSSNTRLSEVAARALLDSKHLTSLARVEVPIWRSRPYVRILSEAVEKAFVQRFGAP